MQDEQERVLSYGERAVGITFNPSGDEDVNKVKELYAQIIDLCNEMRKNCTENQNPPNSEKARLLSVAITEAQTAQMWAVKGITWK